MAIFPRYNIPEQDIPTVRMPILPADESKIKLAEGISKLATLTGSVAGDVAGKKNKLIEATKISEAVMRAELGMDDIVAKIQADRSKHADAPDTFKTEVNKAEDFWYGGLSADQKMEVRARLTPRYIDQAKSTRSIQNRFHVDEAKSTIATMKAGLLRKSYDMGLPDDVAFRDVYQTTTTGGEPDAEGRAEPITSKREFVGNYPTLLGDYVAANLLTKTEAEKELRDTTREMAYGRLHRMLISDNPATVSRGLALLQREEAQPGSTYITDIDPSHRNSSMKEAQGQLVTLENRARTNAEHMRKESERVRTVAEKKEITDLTMRALRGEATSADLNALIQTNQELGTDRVASEHIEELIRKSAQDSATDPQLYGILWDRAIRGQLSATEVLPYAGRRLSRKDAEHLVTVSQQRDATNDEQYKQGYREVENALRPPVGVIDEGRQVRFSEAAREYHDRAVLLLGQNKRHELPQLAREITDRKRGEAPRNTVRAPALAPWYSDPETTFQAWQTQYGQNPKAWPPSARKEFDRQMKQFEELQSDATRNLPPLQQQRAGERKQQPPGKKKKSNLPSPFSQE